MNTKNIFSDAELKTTSERLKAVRKFLRIPRQAMFERYNIPSVSLKAWENGTLKPSKPTLEKCIEAYKQEGILISEEWLLHGKGLPPKPLFQLNQYFSTPKEDNLDNELDDEISMLLDIEHFKKRHKNAVALIVSNDDMHPYYRCGDYVCGKLRYGDDIKSAVNKDCIIHLKNGDVFFRRVIQDKEGRYNLISLNPWGTTDSPVLYNVDIEALAPVILHRWKDD
jgi:phage repressor protein C with HTH and peptisase S24 domain